MQQAEDAVGKDLPQSVAPNADKPELPPAARTPAQHLLSGVWKSATGAEVELADDGATVTISLDSSTRTLRKLDG
ncbi:MAG TPA: hypothetical protein VIK18_19955, partial [Pirellulales bacterium]